MSNFDQEYKNYWLKSYYVLIKSDNPIGYIVMDEETRMMTIFEEGDIGIKVITNMINSGCKIYNSINDLPEPIVPNRWNTTEEWLNFIHAMEKFNLNEEDKNEVARLIVGRSYSQDQMINIIQKYKNKSFD